MPERPLTFGEKACGVNFNPGGHSEVTTIKAACAALIDQLNDARSNLSSDYVGNKEQIRMYSIAITEIQTAQMWAVKAATWQN